ncbi:metal ABC transporter permease [Pararhodobacter zhoushanensis]|uniref:Metal ABC transporter permease n=1 Tax=Pararhodobacter zhoushanensis TaxID=2479545 RepID=A0ABT3H0L7_9RHOB|nr:metal ABC transporter permease [Pararhodobacter zhoushanensis]MCW1933365.1 metal ABC transporter permease [Pararhodobacter zhoushanensis]
MLSPTLITVALAAAMIGALAGVLGTFLVLRGQSLLGDVIAHASLPGVVAGFLISGERGFVPILAGALVSGALAGLSVQLLRRGAGVKSDAALGSVLSLFFALGVVLLTVAQSQGGSAGLTMFLFGQAASVLRADLLPMAVVGGTVLLVLVLLWKEFQLVAFDREAARAQGLPVERLEVLLTLLTAVTIVLGLSLAGVVLMVALLIAPAVAARQWVRGLAPMVWLAALIGALAGSGGAVISAMGQGVATGPVMVLAAVALTALSLLLAPERGLVARWRRQGAARQALRGRQVLAALRGLEGDHATPDYASDEAMLQAYLGTDAGPALARLYRDGLIRPAARLAPEAAARRWELTEAGRLRVEEGGQHA